MFKKVDVIKVLLITLVFCLAEFGWWMFLQWQEEKLESYYLELSLYDLRASNVKLEKQYRDVSNKFENLIVKFDSFKNSVAKIQEKKIMVPEKTVAPAVTAE